MIGQRNTGHHAVLTVEDRDRLGQGNIGVLAVATHGDVVDVAVDRDR